MNVPIGGIHRVRIPTQDLHLVEDWVHLTQ